MLKMYNSSYKYNNISHILILRIPLHGCHQQDGDVLLKHAGGFMFMRNLKFHTIFYAHVGIYK